MKSSEDKRVINFKKLFIIQIYGYLALIPIIFSIFSLIRSYRIRDILVFSIGLIFILVLLIMNHLEPSIRLTPNRVILFNIDRNKPIIINKINIFKLDKINPRLAKLYVDKNKFYEIKLSARQMTRFLKEMEEFC